MLESVCKAILAERRVPKTSERNLNRLMAEVRTTLGLAGDSELCDLLNGLESSMKARAKIRAAAGADHGLGPGEDGVDPEVAELFVNIAVFLRREAI